MVETTPSTDDILVRTLYVTGPAAASLPNSTWERLIREAREANLLGTLEHRLREGGQLEAVPAGPRAHLLSGQIVASAQDGVVRREIREIHRALQGLDVKVVLLKGAAYLMAGLPCSKGRVFSDVDILVPKPRLPQVEAALMLAGYATTHHHPYDQRYYRRWRHELPPMQHLKRGTVLDVHHTIVASISGVRLDPAALFDAALPLEAPSGFWVLAPADMVLHSATHLFNNEDMTHALRDLIDIDVLLRHFGRNAGFWEKLVERAMELDLCRPLHYALRWTTRLFCTPIPDAIRDAQQLQAPPRVVSATMDALLRHALRPTALELSTRWARRALYVRGHWLKMPVHMLAWHLTVKAFRREKLPIQQ
jgi:hypothetical protein